MRQNPERIAWIILWTAFCTFCTLTVSVPGSLYWYITRATQFFQTELTSVRGTVLYGSNRDAMSSSLVDGQNQFVEESYSVSTDDTSQAILTFTDDTTLTMYSNTTITLLQTQIPLYEQYSQAATSIVVYVEKGRVRATSSRSRNDLNFDVHTPHATMELGQGSFSIDVETEETQVTTRVGEAIVYSEEEMVTLEKGERAVASSVSKTPLTDPLPAAQNLLKNSDFNFDFRKDWETYEIDPNNVMTNTARIEMFQDQSVLVLQSEGEDNVHTENGVVQQVGKDVRDFQSLRLFAEVRLVHQSLPGGGQLGSEFPIMLHISYKDANNNDREWLHGFYYSPPPDNYILYDQPDNSSERIPRYIWYPYESVNLLTALGPEKPVFIKSVRIYSSGWIYEAMIANISLLGQE